MLPVSSTFTFDANIVGASSVPPISRSTVSCHPIVPAPARSNSSPNVSVPDPLDMSTVASMSNAIPEPKSAWTKYRHVPNAPSHEKNARVVTPAPSAPRSIETGPSNPPPTPVSEVAPVGAVAVAPVGAVSAVAPVPPSLRPSTWVEPLEHEPTTRAASRAKAGSARRMGPLYLGTGGGVKRGRCRHGALGFHLPCSQGSADVPRRAPCHQDR